MGRKSTRGADGLTDLERRFGVLYLASFNATEAYIEASPSKVSRRTAEANGYKLLQLPQLQAFVKAERDRLMNKAELSVAETLEKLRQFLMYDARKLFDTDGSLLPMDEWPDDVAAAVVGVEDTMAGRKVKLVDKNSALEKALKYHGLFERDNKQRTDPLTELLQHVYSDGGSRLKPVE